MIENDGTGRYTLSYECEAVLRRIPLEKRGLTKKGNEWVLGGCLVEAVEDGSEGSAQLYLATFDPELIELVNVIGVGKRVRVKFHIETREYYDSFRTSAILDGIRMTSDGEDFLVGGRK